MKLLFVIDRVHAEDDPNINLVRGLLPSLAQSADAPEVRFLGHTAQAGQADALCFYYGRDEAVRALYFSLAGLSAAQKALRLLRQPVNSLFGAFKTLHVDLIAAAYRKRIETVCRDWQPDAVIAVAAPFYTAKAVAAARVSCRKILWMFDPYGTHYLMGGPIAQRQEARCIARADTAFVPELLAAQYRSVPNVRPMAFPGLVPPDAHSDAALPASTTMPALSTPPAPSNLQGIAQNPVQLVFVGSLYADIRNPAPLLRLVRALGECMPVQLTLVGGLYGAYSPAFHEEFDAFLQQSVTLTGKVDRQTAQAYLQRADVLVNIGNTVENQLPSKIFECFATGLPLLNLKQLSACPADAPMRKYPLACTVDTTKPLSKEIVQQVAGFLRQNAGKRLPFAAVQALYPENTPQAAAQKLLAAVKGSNA